MGLDVSIRVRKRSMCPHCGEPYPGDIVDDMDVGGHYYHQMLDQIDYKALDDCGDYKNYGKYVVLDRDQMLKVCKALNTGGDVGAAKAVANALVTQDFVELEADW